MESFVIADPHFRHENVMRYNRRPFDNIEAHDEGMIENWNSVVPRKNSIVYILGDFAFQDHGKIFHRLNGKKVLVLGSHDKMSREEFEMCTRAEDSFFMDNYRTFTGVYDSLMLRLDGRLYFMTHCCPRVWEKGHYGVPCLFGHSHNRLTTFNMSFDVGVDTKISNYRPIHFSVIDKEVERRRQIMHRCERVRRENGKTIYYQDDVQFIMSLMSAETLMKIGSPT